VPDDPDQPQAARVARDRLTAQGKLLVGTFKGMPAHAVQLTEDAYPLVWQWAPGKARWQGGRSIGLTVWSCWTSNQIRQACGMGDWIVHLTEADVYVVVTNDAWTDLGEGERVHATHQP
jgi:hypothetical protein